MKILLVIFINHSAYKIYFAVFDKRIRPVIQVIITDEESSFSKGRSCIDNVFFTVQQIINKRRHEFNRETRLEFLDYEKSVKGITKVLLWIVLEKRRISNLKAFINKYKHSLRRNNYYIITNC